MELEFYYDVVCPYAWLGALQVQALAARTGARVRWRPVLLGGLLQGTGAPERPAETWSAQRQVLIAQDLLREAARQGVSPVYPPDHPRRTVNAMRLVLSAPEARWPEVSLRLWRAYWEEGLDLSRPAVLAGLAVELGLDPAAPDDPALKAELRRRTDEALALGVFGVPTFRAAGRQWWGQDRLPQVLAALGGPTRHAGWGPPRAPSGGVLRFYHDFASPFSYLAGTQVTALAASRGVEVAWTPLLLGGLFRRIGTPDVPIAAMSAPKQRQMMQDLVDWAAWWDVPFQFPACFPVRTVLPLRVSLVEPRAIAPLYHALWAQGVDIGQPEALAGVLRAAGLDAPALLAQAEDPAVKATLKANGERAEALGVCGVPTVELPDGRLWWGQDRLERVAEALDSAG